MDKIEKINDDLRHIRKAIMVLATELERVTKEVSDPGAYRVSDHVDIVMNHDYS
jgi:hypothetical protein